MSIQIVKVESHCQLKKFVVFPLKLYRDSANWVPALEGDEYDTFNPAKNGAYDFCEADCFLAYRGNEIVGRVAGIIKLMMSKALFVLAGSTSSKMRKYCVL